MPVIFFDVGGTLADARVEPDGSLTLHPRPRVMAVLDALRDVRTGIISDPGPGAGAASRAAAALHEAFPGRFADEALVHWGAKDGRGIFDRAVAGAGEATADDCVFVGEDARERAFAREAGMRTAADPVFARAATQNRPVHRAWIELPDGRGLPELTTAVNDTEAVVVRRVSERLVLAMVTTRGTDALERAGFPVDLQEPVDSGPVDDAERRASEKFISDLLARGEAVYEGEEPTPRTTHVVTSEDDGRLTVRRLRFR
ncbi:HAD family hydrolase [Streptomyces sp. NRRL WC-3725]|uniref:HAD family hydrolase n=1 Tax=Streptomyces sp. NRRL WC-3725 TaxID=1463933 RepID=UPI000AB398EF|nr:MULTISPECIES: HAD family hydrolase [Streptomyces]